MYLREILDWNNVYDIWESWSSESHVVITYNRCLLDGHTTMWSHFSWNSKETVLSCGSMTAEIHISFSVFTVGKNAKNHWKALSGYFIYFGPAWPLFNQSPYLHQHMNGWTTDNVHCQPPNTIRKLNDDFKGFAQAVLYNINKCGYTLRWTSLTEAPPWYHIICYYHMCPGNVHGTVCHAISMHLSKH